MALPSVHILKNIAFISKTMVYLFQAIYRKVMPLYFPRSRQEEEFLVNELPDDIGKSVDLRITYLHSVK